MDNLQEIVALWDKYHQTIAVDAMEYDKELKRLLFANSNVCDVSDTNIGELISKRQAIDASIEAVNSWNKSCSIGQQKRIENYIKQLPPVQPEIIYCKDCKYWNNGSCECREHAVNCQDYMVGDIETEAEHFCGYAERREDG